MQIPFLGIFWFWLILGIAHNAQASDDAPLQAEDAFRLSAAVKDEQTLRFTWRIAEGYYLYRHKFTFISTVPEVGIGAPVFPAGQIKQDHYYGTVEIYRERLDLELPLQRQNPKPTVLKVELTYQGCADQGFCYLPIRQNLDLQLPAAIDTAP